MNNKLFIKRGFTLVELMIVVVIVAILASIGYPAYTDHVNSSRRAEATSALLSAAAAQERFYTANSRYASGIGGVNGLPISNTSETGLYSIEVDNNTGGTYLLTADPVNADAECDELTLTNTGVRDVTGTGSVADCWQ